MSKAPVGKKIRSSPGSSYQILFFSPLQKIMESIWEMHFLAFYKDTISIFSCPSAPTMGGTLRVTKYVTNGMPKKSLGTALIKDVFLAG